MFRLKSGEEIVATPPRLTPDVQPFFEEVLAKIDSQDRAIVQDTIDLRPATGPAMSVETDEGDEIIFAQRAHHLRIGPSALTRFVKNREPKRSSTIHVILERRHFGKYFLKATWWGIHAEPFPWDQNKTEQSVAFWARHALIWEPESFKIIPGTETTQCPW